MTSSSLRAVLAATVLSAAMVLVAGCAPSPATPAPSSSASAPDSSDDGIVDDDHDDMEAALLDDGRMFAVVTWGSSTCVPMIDGVSADGQTVSVALVDPDPDAACTADMAARASVGGLPEGVDPTREIELVVTYGDVTDDVDLDGDASFSGVPGSETEYAPSAGWFDDQGLVLLTWGSSSCVPTVDSLEQTGNAATVTLAASDGPCTMDMAPRATIVQLEQEHDDDQPFELTLVGADLDTTITLPGD